MWTWVCKRVRCATPIDVVVVLNRLNYIKHFFPHFPVPSSTFFTHIGRDLPWACENVYHFLTKTVMLRLKKHILTTMSSHGVLSIRTISTWRFLDKMSRSEGMCVILYSKGAVTALLLHHHPWRWEVHPWRWEVHPWRWEVELCTNCHRTISCPNGEWQVQSSPFFFTTPLVPRRIFIMKACFFIEIVRVLWLLAVLFHTATAVIQATQFVAARPCWCPAGQRPTTETLQVSLTTPLMGGISTFIKVQSSNLSWNWSFSI